MLCTKNLYKLIATQIEESCFVTTESCYQIHDRNKMELWLQTIL